MILILVFSDSQRVKVDDHVDSFCFLLKGHKTGAPKGGII